MPEDRKSSETVLEGNKFSAASPSLILRRDFFGTIWTTQMCFVSEWFYWFPSKGKPTISWCSRKQDLALQQWSSKSLAQQSPSLITSPVESLYSNFPLLPEANYFIPCLVWMSVGIKRIEVAKEVCKALACRLTGVIIPRHGLTATSSPKFETKVLCKWKIT